MSKLNFHLNIEKATPNINMDVSTKDKKETDTENLTEKNTNILTINLLRQTHFKIKSCLIQKLKNKLYPNLQVS